MTRVVFVLQEPTPYRTPQLAAFAELPGIETTLVYAARTVQRRTWRTPEPEQDVVYLSGPSLPLTRILQHDYPLTPSIWPVLGRLRPQLLVVGGWSLMATQLAVVWARIHHVPYVLMSDNHQLEPRPLWVRAVKRMVLRFVVPQAAAWLVPGTLGRQHVLDYGARPERVLTFPLTTDVDAVIRRTDELRVHRAEIRTRLGIPEDSIAVLHVGRLIPQKSVDVLVRAVARAAEAQPRLHLVIVGSGPEETALRALVDDTGIAATFTGFIEDDELLEVLVAADVFALLSRRETWGVVVNEAAASGLPLVLSDGVGAHADLLEPGRNGELVAAGDVEAAAQALLLLARDSSRREDYGRRSREIVRGWGYGPSVAALSELVSEIAP